MRVDNTYDLDMRLIDFAGPEGSSLWTLREACEGVMVWGATGAGKTSSLKLLALKYLANGFGGLVLSAKNELDTWKAYCRLTGRLDDLVVVEFGSENYFNFIQYESARKIGGISITENIVEVLRTVVRASAEKSGGGRSEESFWQEALDLLLFSTVDLCQLAFSKVSVKEMFDIVTTAPKKGQIPEKGGKPKTGSFAYAFEAAQKKVNAQVAAYLDSLSPAEKEKAKDPDYFENVILEAIPDAKLLKSIDQFFSETYRNLAERTRSIIEFSFSGFLFRLMKEPFYSLFSKHVSTFIPEDCYLKGKIILLHLPVKQFHKAGRDMQIMFKYIWQRAMERRDVTQNDRPVFLWSDEMQHFLHEHDSDYQATARSGRICSVYLSQNLANFYASMGGDKYEHRVMSLLGNLGTKIFFCNADVQTNRYASDLIGEAYTEDISRGTTISGEFSTTRNASYKLEKIIRPEAFVSLKTGGLLNKSLVEAYVHRQGRTFDNGMNFKKITFKQN